jgi:adenylosuccinate synthase
MPQAGHWVRNDDGGEYFYQTFNSCAYQDKYERLLMGPGSIIELPALFREIEESNIDPKKIGISPTVAILQDIDAAFERGEVNLDGNPIELSDGTMKHGSTCHGVGAARARRILRRPNTLLARDIPQLAEFICDVPGEIMGRLDHGEAGLLEVAQGFQLSYCLSQFYPYCTSRNCTISAGLDDLMLPPKYAGDVVLNFRTFPIRIANDKYVGEDGHHLTWDEIQEGVPHTVYKGSSGPGYDDQEEISWDIVTEQSKSEEPIIELTSVTKMPRRVFTFSKKNLLEAIKYNDTGQDIHISINFANYVDATMKNKRGSMASMTDDFRKWLVDNVTSDLPSGVRVSFLGTGAKTDDMLTWFV